MTAKSFPKLGKKAHKYSHGKVLAEVGSEKYPGAAILSLAGVRSTNVGYISWFSNSPKLKSELLQTYPDLIFLDSLTNATANCFLLGSGIENPEWNLASNIADSKEKLGEKISLVLDGAAVSLAKESNADFTIITPHEGEAKVFGVDLSNRKLAALKIAQENNLYLVLKGFHTIIATPSGLWEMDVSGGNELARAGTGDLLAGLITGFIACWKPETEQEMLKVLASAVKVHSRAGRYAKKRFKYPTATDLIFSIRKVIR
jgi:hydroxyethylthiazole kinase-like uncharacterized protein yjeF